MFCFPRQWEYVIKERKGEDTFYNTVPFLWTSWIKIFHKTEFLIHGLCFPQMHEKWIIISEEDRRPGAVRTIAVSHEPGAHFFMTTLCILLCPWGYSFHSSCQQHIGSVVFRIYSFLVQKKMMSSWTYLSLTLETALTGDKYWIFVSDPQKEWENVSDRASTCTYSLSSFCKRELISRPIIKSTLSPFTT